MKALSRLFLAAIAAACLSSCAFFGVQCSAEGTVNGDLVTRHPSYQLGVRCSQQPRL